MPGPNDITGLNAGIFEYTTVAALREEGLSTQFLDDARARKLIRRFSAEVNDLTGQWFAPVMGRAQVDGKDSAILRLPNNMPFIRVDQLRLLDRGFDQFVQGGFLIDRDEYVIHQRSVELVRLTFKPSSVFSLGDSSKVTGSGRQTRGVGNFFPQIPKGIFLTGAFGWVESKHIVKRGMPDERVGIEMETQALLAVGGTSVEVDDTTGVRVGDVINLGDNGGPRAIVTDITAGPPTIHFESGAIEEDVPSGTTLFDFGRVPQRIEYAVQLMVYYHRREEFSLIQTDYAPAASPDLPAQGATPSAFNTNPATSGGPNILGTGTGIPRVDQILSEFTAPPMVALI